MNFNAIDISKIKIPFIEKGSLIKILLAMKLTVILMLAAVMQISAKAYTQQFTFSEKNASLEKVFKQIKAQSEYVFFYEQNVVDKAMPININVKKASLKTVLDLCFENQPLSYKIVGKTVVVKSVEKSLPTIPIILNLDIQGRVINDQGEPLEAVSVVIKGTSKGTTTNSEGRFNLTAVDENAVLVFSAVGYTSQEIEVKGRKIVIVKLSLFAAQQEEVIIASTGYQTISKERATGSFDIIDPQVLGRASTNIASRLVGQVAGLQSKLDVDGNPTFQIRGLTTLFAGTQSAAQVNSDPLIVVDGFAIEGGVSSINPNDVASVTVLKDAAASSIWGARAANGVIVITTKKASKNASLKVELNAFTRIGKKFDLDYANPKASGNETIDFEKFTFGKQWAASTNSGSLSNYSSLMPLVSTLLNENSLGYISEEEMNKQIAGYRNLSNKQQIYDNLIANPVNTQVNLRISGGGAKMNNSLSLLYENNQSNYKETYSKRYMINYQSSSKVFKWLDFNLISMFQLNENHNNGVSMGDISELSPYQMLLDKDGGYLNIPQYYWPVMERFVPMSSFPYPSWTYNPIKEIKNRDLKTNVLNFRLQGGLTFTILKGLTFESKMQYERVISDSRSLNNDETFEVRKSVNEASTWDQATNTIK
ncbi:MAG: SusC/RagA family TonB-linked outer membrane protein, partial [Chitinophagaceae bacterium]